MASWTDIASSQTDADSPIDVPLMQALVDNDTAQPEQASGAPASIGTWHLLGTATPSAAGSVDFDDLILRTYAVIMLTGSFTAGDPRVALRFGISGATYRTSGYLSATAYTSGIELTDGFPVSTGEQYNIVAYIFDAYDATKKTHVQSTFTHDDSTEWYVETGAGVYNTAESHTSVRLDSVTGSFTGLVQLWGLPTASFTL